MTLRGSDNDCELVKKKPPLPVNEPRGAPTNHQHCCDSSTFFFVEPRAASSKQEAPSFCARQTKTKKNAQHAHALHAPLDMKVCKRH